MSLFDHPAATLPSVGATREEFLQALAAQLSLQHDRVPATQWAMVSAVQLNDAEIFWVCNSRHPVAESLRATWTRLRQDPESNEQSSQFMRGVGVMRTNSLLTYEPSHLYQRLLLGQRPAGADVEVVNRAAACARSLTNQEANWIFTAASPAAMNLRSSLATLWGDTTWFGGLDDFANGVAAMRDQGLVDQSDATIVAHAADSGQNKEAPIISSEAHPLLQHILEQGNYDNTVSLNSDAFGDKPTFAAIQLMFNAHELKTIHEDESLTACMYDDTVLVLLWRRPINLLSVQALEAPLADIAQRLTRPAALLSVATPEAQASFESSARQLNLQLLHRHQNVLTTAVGVIEGGGPRAALLRAATRLIMAAAPRWLKMEIRSNASVACLWLSQHHPGVQAAGLTEAIETMRHPSRRVAV